MDNKETAQRLKALIAENKHGEAIEEMLKIVEANGGDGEDGLLILLTRKNKLDQQIHRNTIGKEDAGLEQCKITESLFLFAEKIGNGEKINFSISPNAKDLIEHDKKVQKKLSRLFEFSLFASINEELKNYQSIKKNSQEKLLEIRDFLIDPSNKFMHSSISEKANLFLADIEKLLQANMEHEEIKKATRINFLDIKYFFLKSISGGSLIEQVVILRSSNKLGRIVEELASKFTELRLEIKHKLFI